MRGQHFHCRLSPLWLKLPSYSINGLSAFDLPFLHFFREKPLTQAPGHPPSDTDHILQLQLCLPFQVSLTSGCTKQPLFSKYTSVHQGITILHKLSIIRSVLSHLHKSANLYSFFKSISNIPVTISLMLSSCSLALCPSPLKMFGHYSLIVQMLSDFLSKLTFLKVSYSEGMVLLALTIR